MRPPLASSRSVPTAISTNGAGARAGAGGATGGARLPRATAVGQQLQLKRKMSMEAQLGSLARQASFHLNGGDVGVGVGEAGGVAARVEDTGTGFGSFRLDTIGVVSVEEDDDGGDSAEDEDEGKTAGADAGAGAGPAKYAYRREQSAARAGGIHGADDDGADIAQVLDSMEPLDMKALAADEGPSGVRKKSSMCIVS
eukprot:g2638.t1